MATPLTCEDVRTLVRAAELLGAHCEQEFWTTVPLSPSLYDVAAVCRTAFLA
jgi:hypothetical protein